MERLVVEYRSISELIPYDKNPRNNANAIEKVAASIKEFGFKNPVIVDQDNVIVAGHTRLLAAETLGYSEVPTLQVTDLTPDQIRAFRIADNKVSEFAEWDEDLLSAELEELKLSDYELELTGFDLAELGDLLSGSSTYEPDREEREEPVYDSYEDSYYEREEEREPINDEGFSDPMGFEYKMTIGKMKLILTEEEHNKLLDKVNEYVEENGVTFGFVRWLLEGE